MPSDWIKLGGVVTNLANALDIGYRYVPSEEVAGKNAADVLKQVDKVLQGSRIVLDNHKDVLSPQEYEDLKHTYRRYHWQMTDESQEFRATTDERIRQSRILSQLYANRYSHEQRARNLLRKVEVYQTTVLAASRNATVADLKPFDDELPASSGAAAQSVASESSLPSSYTSWFSVPWRPASSRSTSLQDNPMSLESDPNKVYEAEGACFLISFRLRQFLKYHIPDQNFIVTVTHFPKPAVDVVGEEETAPYQAVIGAGAKLYRRMISFERGDQRVEIKDTRSYALDDNETYVAEEALQQMSELGQRLLNESDLSTAQALQPAADTTQSSSLEATIQKFRKVSIVHQE